MEFVHQRLWSNNEQTFGFIRDTKRLYKAWVLEDEYRDKKVKGETRIPAKKYFLGIRKQDTPLTLKHRESYNSKFKDDKGNFIEWFKYHIEVLDVENFSGIYYHSGVDQTHTDGCQLLADICNLTSDKNPLSSSLTAVKRFYDLVYPLLEKNIQVTVTIKDEIALML